MLTASEAIDYANSAYGNHPGFRALHAKGQFFTGTFSPSPSAATLCRAANFQSEIVPAYVRFSSGSGHPHAHDTAPDVRGMAVSFRLPQGGGTDIVAQTAPRFPARDPQAFLELVKAGGLGTRRPWLMVGFLARHPRSIPPLAHNLLAGAISPRRSFLQRSYYAVHAYRWLAPDGGARWVRYVWRPAGGTPVKARPARTPHGVYDHLQAQLAIGPIRFALEVQIAGPGDDPHDPSAVWRSKERITAGILEIAGPDPARQSADAKGQVFVFDPGKLTDGIEASDDPILAYRIAAYSESAHRRSQPMR